MRDWIILGVLAFLPFRVHGQYLNARDILAHNKSGVVVVETERATGTGFFVNREGWIVTNKHVVRDLYGYTTDYLLARLPSGQRFRARDIIVDPRCDLAVFRVEYHPKVLLPMRPSAESAPSGSSILTIGHPKGEEWLVTTGPPPSG